ncbi:DNA-binding transcriptional regulator LsrR (DeoR family) [Enterococcus sp. PF1-24]|uniref:winged helix-turn-helix transcriptional regulator n=1 Tax=unclassified Enterococcus TaxID=2608891 RepID=UPI0024769CFE|nr:MULTISPECIES: winged helix-turn-helix transcriptional regulator [unclassified Enterococcus]MDH6363497.1 DNA-binding transcriptional regulator LsrR (DeoR family) [Enterococcus sp. PFB1-1]MDH6400591.1 DNA-binding transcriptional regulator LsrR (DeoR family) [Enterococcus sp. PF1-24]
MGKYTEEFLIQVAYLYYIKEKTQNEISKELKLNQTTISRILQEAKEKGIVKFSIKNDTYTDLLGLQSYIQEKYQLKKVLIVNQKMDVSADEKLFEIARKLVQYFYEITYNGSVVGVDGGGLLEKNNEFRS